MKIDIHLHTKRIKAGDSENREIDPSSFCEIIKNTDVKIGAITNHNHFDKEQYLQIINQSENYFQIWPGVELDLVEGDKRGHLIIIVNPKYVDSFSDTLNKITSGIQPDDFSVSIKETVNLFDSFDPLYIPHYLNKLPCISDDLIQILYENVSNNKRILKEATNSISAGIFVSHGHKAIYGSDIQNWNDYINISRDLPDLRLPVESYEQFCLLLDRDDSTIRTILDKKNHERIALNPFPEDASPIILEIYDDINVLFGSKGTGKTEILKALSNYYNNHGYKTSVYESNEMNLDSKYDIKGKNYFINREDLEFDLCIDDISFVRNASEGSVTSLKKYYEYFSRTETNKISKQIKINNFSPTDRESINNKFDDIKEFKKQLKLFKSLLLSNTTYKEIIEEDLFDTLITILDKVAAKVNKSFENHFIQSSTIRLFNHLIKIFVTEISKKTGQPEKPIKTGFLEYARNRIDLEIALKKIVNAINYKINPKSEFVGELGAKGKLFCKTSLVIQNGKINDGDLKPIKNVNKTPQKLVAKMFYAILKEVYTKELFKKIGDLNRIENGATISSVEDLLLFKRYFEVNHVPYKPSNGESAMILLRHYNDILNSVTYYVLNSLFI